MSQMVARFTDNDGTFPAKQEEEVRREFLNLSLLA